MAPTRTRCWCSRSCRRGPIRSRSSSCSPPIPRSRAGSSASSICRAAWRGTPGLTNGYVSQDIQGQVPGTEIFYSIQGNILRAGNVVPNAVQAFLKTQGAMTDRVMAAMEAADGSGGDSRCACPPWPTDGSDAEDAVRRTHVARRLHPDGGEGRHQRRLAQQRQVRDVHHRVAARGRQGARPDQGRRKPESGEDAAHALRRSGARSSRRRSSREAPCESYASNVISGCCLARARRESPCRAEPRGRDAAACRAASAGAAAARAAAGGTQPRRPGRWPGGAAAVAAPSRS